jgi:ribosomal protein S18 acetylase RimI-like enzyme/8-oxo-dGTP pyrophosphatase MutT (NUDIX family)
VVIRPATASDADAIWHIFTHVVAGRDSYAFAPDTTRDEGVGYWFGPEVTSFVAELEGSVLGMYKLTANHRDLGAHVANASFMVAPEAAGRGIGRAMGVHCLHEARVQGYEAMQFNFVVSTNRRAVALWQSLGFQIVGTLPRAFQHGTLGMVDAYVMYRFLDDIVPTFGLERRNADATIRLCAYAVIPADSPDSGHPSIALVRTPGGVMLPGGALEADEDATAAVVREVAEECALDVTVRRLLGEAVQFVGGHDGRPLVEKRSRFFSARVQAPLSRRPDHEVAWLTTAEALDAVTNDSHKWAIRRWQRCDM